jgi:hypothetical protein
METVADRSNETPYKVDERGVVLTVEGMARARKRLAEAAARNTPERKARLRELLGLTDDDLS